MRTPTMLRFLVVGLVAAAGAGAVYLLSPAPAAAHGKEVLIELRCAPAQSATPLDQNCEAVVTAANDGDPISDASLTLDAVRPAKGDHVSGQALRPTGQAGHYQGGISLNAYGTWTITAQVQEPAEGRIDVTQEVLPPSAAASPVAETRARLLISFNARDVANIAALIAHLLGTIALFAATAAIVIVGLVAQGQHGARQRQRVARSFPWLAGASFAIIAASGFYNAMYNSPTRSPGLLHPGDVASLPYGDAYLVTFGVKMLFAVALMLGTAMLAFQLRRSGSWLVPPVAGGAEAVYRGAASRHSPLAELRRDACVSWAATNLMLGGALMMSVIVLDYLHLLSHVGVFVGA